jgi:hypothetical protein
MKLIIEIEERLDNVKEQVRVRRINGQVVMEEFYLTVEGLIHSMMESLVSQAVHSPILPSRCVQYSMLDQSRGTWQAVLEIPKERYTITYNENIYKNVGFPRMMAVYRVGGERTLIHRIFAVQDGESLNKDSKLYLFPFSHVTMEGQVCMGRNQLPAVKEVKDLESFHLYFLTTPFGTDYGAKTVTGKTLKELFTELQEKDFPEEWLVPSKWTLGEMIEKLK